MTLRKNFLLASNSSSRYRLLKSAGLKFQTTKPLCNEELIKEKLLNLKINIKNLPKYLAKEKALSVSKKTNSLVVGSDTVIVFQNTLISKAKNLNEAKKKLQKLSGKKHKIISGVTITMNGKTVCDFYDITNVKIKNLTNSNISEYLKQTGNQILSSVGCYQIESLGPQIIEYIEGDFFNVMGIPLFKLLKYISRIK